MDQSPTPVFADPVAQLEQALCGREAYEKLQSALALLDFVGVDIAGAHVSQAIQALHSWFDMEETWSKADEPLRLPFPGS